MKTYPSLLFAALLLVGGSPLMAGPVATGPGPGPAPEVLFGPGDLEIEPDVLSIDGEQIRADARVSIEHWGGTRPLQGRIRLVESSGFTKISALGFEEQRVNVIIDFTDKIADRPGLGDAFRIEPRIVIWENPAALRVPAGALFRSEGKWSLFLVENGRAVLRRVEIGHMNDDHAEVLGGVSEGTRVIICPTERVKDGYKVQARP